MVPEESLTPYQGYERRAEHQGFWGNANRLYEKYKLVVGILVVGMFIGGGKATYEQLVRNQRFLIYRDSVQELRLGKLERRISIQAYDDCVKMRETRPPIPYPRECDDVIKEVREGQGP